MPIFRAGEMTAPSWYRAEQKMASGLVALILVNWALRVGLALLEFFDGGDFQAQVGGHLFHGSKPDLVKTSSFP